MIWSQTECTPPLHCSVFLRRAIFPGWPHRAGLEPVDGGSKSQGYKFGHEILHMPLSLTTHQYPIHLQFLAMLPLTYFPNAPTSHHPNYYYLRADCHCVYSRKLVSLLPLLGDFLCHFPPAAKGSFRNKDYFVSLSYLTPLKGFLSHLEWDPKFSW